MESGIKTIDDALRVMIKDYDARKERLKRTEWAKVDSWFINIQVI